MTIEHKTVSAELKSIDDQGEGVLRFIRFEQEDKDGDITRPGFIGRQEAVLLVGHNWKSDFPPLGKGESFEADGATNFRFKLNLADPRVQTWYSWLKMDQQAGTPLQQVSYGFSPHADGQERAQKEGRNVRYLKPRKDGSPGAKLHEVSLVTVGSGNDQGVLSLKAFEDLPEPEEMDGSFEDLKQAGVRIQSLIFPKSKWESAEAVRSWLRSHDFSTTLDETGSSYRARQEAPGRFQRLRSFCVNPSRDASAEACRVMAVGGPMKESRSVESESRTHPSETSSGAGAPDGGLPPTSSPRSSIGDSIGGKESPEMPGADQLEWTNYDLERRPPLPVLTKWLRLYRYHMPFLRDIRKRDGKEVSPETIGEFTALVKEMLEVATQFNIKVMTASLLPNVEESILLQQHFDARHKELTSVVNADSEREFQKLQERAGQLAQQSAARLARIREWGKTAE